MSGRAADANANLFVCPNRYASATFDSWLRRVLVSLLCRTRRLRRKTKTGGDLDININIWRSNVYNFRGFSFSSFLQGPAIPRQNGGMYDTNSADKCCCVYIFFGSMLKGGLDEAKIRFYLVLMYDYMMQWTDAHPYGTT